MEDSRQDLRTECRGGGGVVGFGRIWPCISRDVRRRRASGGVPTNVRIAVACEESSQRSKGKSQKAKPQTGAEVE
jgi:hypothetical protein